MLILYVIFLKIGSSKSIFMQKYHTFFTVYAVLHSYFFLLFKN